jgi:hypothetical protein
MGYIGQTPTAVPLDGDDLAAGIIVNSHVNASAAIVGTKLTALAGNVAFPATQSASADANTLDDYEEGTWTPTLQSHNANAAKSSEGTVLGRYTKIGRYVSLFVYIYSTNVSDAGTGGAQIHGLPFALPATYAFTSSVEHIVASKFSSEPTAVFGRTGESRLSFITHVGGQPTLTVSSGYVVFCTFNYFQTL